MRVVGRDLAGDPRPGGVAAGVRQLPPVGMDAQLVEPGHGAGERAVVDRRLRLAGDHLEQQVVPGAAAGVGQHQHLPLLLRAQRRRGRRGGRTPGT